MTEQSFKVPGFYAIETDLSAPVKVQPSGVPAAVVGTSLRGPAFVPVTVSNFPEFAAQFGPLDPKRYGPYSMNEFLKNRSSATFVRVLGAGSNETSADISETEATGRVKNAGTKIMGGIVEPSADPTTDPVDFRHSGTVQFIAAKHEVSTYEAFGLPMFTNNNSFGITGPGQDAYLLRAMVWLASDARMMVLNGGETPSPTTFLPAITSSIPSPDDVASLNDGLFKLVISSSAGASFATTDGLAGIRIFSASFDPTSVNYVGKILNTDPTKFGTEKHYLHLDFAVDAEIAAVSADTGSIAILSGSADTVPSGDATINFRNAFGLFDTRFKTPKTSWFISQPFGRTENDLFYVEALDDGEFANNKFKISISGLKMSVDPTYLYGTFTLSVRLFSDTDLNQQIVESFSNLSLDPSSANYIAKKIGDIKYRYNFDSNNEDERRVMQDGKNANQSRLIRVVMHENVENKLTSPLCLPFGFRGVQILKSNVQRSANGVISDLAPLGEKRLGGTASGIDTRLLGSLVPPMPYRFKITRGPVETSPPAANAFAGYPGINEIVDSRLHWGVKFERNNIVLNPNTIQETNPLIAQMSKFMGLKNLDLLVTGSDADSICDNKFTLAKVALSNTSIDDITGSVDVHMKEAAYMRDATLALNDYRIIDSGPTSPISRVTMATLFLEGSRSFNKFSDYLKFSTVMYGGFDGVNILDKETFYLTDKAASTAEGGGAYTGFTSPGFASSMAGIGSVNSTVGSYRVGAKIATDPTFASINKTVPSANVISVPGIRDPYVTDYVMDRVREYGLGIYLMDIPSYDDDGVIIFDGDASSYPNVDQTIEQLDRRAIDNNAVAVYYPDVTIRDNFNSRLISVPPSIAAISAIGFNDRVGYPWYVPAGTNRASLDFVSSVAVRLDTKDQAKLQDSRINPIVKMPTENNQTFYAIMGQKNMKQSKSALDRVNVVRMLLEVKRVVVDITQRLIFNNDIPAQRKQFVALVTPVLSSIQTRQGIDKFVVICDERNNGDADVLNQKFRATIKLVPTRAIEYAEINFIITNGNVEFV